MNEWIIRAAQYIFPALAVLVMAAYIIRSFFRNEQQKRELEFRLHVRKESMPVRLQAYERIALFLERIAPAALIQRLRQNEMSAKQFHLTLLSGIRSEFEHNVVQQIYLSPELWLQVAGAKEETIGIINRVASMMPPTASSADLARGILEFVVQSEHALPGQRALDALKAEVHKLF